MIEFYCFFQKIKLDDNGNEIKVEKYDTEDEIFKLYNKFIKKE